MARYRLLLTVVAGFGLAAEPTCAVAESAVSPVLTAQPIAGARGLPAGATTLPGGALAYRPPSATKEPLPLVVLFHGYGFSAEQFMSIMTPVADRWGFMLVAPKAEHVTWDMIYRGMNEDQSRSRVITHSKPRFGKDIARIDAALKEMFASAPVDPRHVVLLGFSDGATYALAVGLANPQLFTTVIWLSRVRRLPRPGVEGAKDIRRARHQRRTAGLFEHPRLHRRADAEGGDAGALSNVRREACDRPRRAPRGLGLRPGRPAAGGRQIEVAFGWRFRIAFAGARTAA